MVLLAASLANAGVVLRNDTNTSDTYDESDQVAWLEFPECAISVLEAQSGDLPLAIDTVWVYLGSNTGNQDGTSTYVDVSLQLLADGEDPTPTHMEWGPESFYVAVSSQQINELPLVDEESGLTALDYTGGRVAVWVCAPDPSTGSAWPRTSDRDTSGIVIDTGSPSAGSWLYYRDSVQSLATFVRGSWIIRAGEGDADTDTDADTDADTDSDTDTDTDTDADAAVAIGSITPREAVFGVPVDVAVLGEGFQEGAAVFIGGLAVSSVARNGDTALAGTTPSALPVGTHDVVVTNPDGSADTLEAAFTVTEAGCGCASTGGGSALGALVGALAFLRRRPPR